MHRSHYFKTHQKQLMLKQISQKQRGFSLIEFMVASLIGIIILLAAGATFVMTRNLNQQASERLAAQQDLRHASNLIIRDARQVGSFGCASLAANNVVVDNGHGINSTSSLYLRPAWNESDGENNYGLHITNAAGFIATTPVNGQFLANGDALIFIYGDGFAGINTNPANPNTVSNLGLTVDANDAVGQVLSLVNGGVTAPLVLSSCNRIKVLNRGAGGYTRINTNNIALNPAVAISPSINDAFKPGQLGISKLAAAAYVTGSVAGSNMTGLYRFNLQADGTWSQPQLLVADLLPNNGMTMQFGYVEQNACPDGTSTNNEQFHFTDNLQNIVNYSKLPALIRIRLNVLDGNNRSNSNTDIGTIQQYIIDATVRGGNVCANRSL